MKLKAIVYTVLIFLIILLQSTVLNYLKIFDVKPNLVLIFIVSVALLQGNTEGAVIGFFTGLSQDIISGKVIGFYSLLGLYLGFTVGSLNKRLYRDNILVVVIFTFISSIAYESLVYFFYFFGQIIKGQADLLYTIKEIILPEALYNSIVSVFVYLVVMKLSEKFEVSEKSSRKY